MADIRKLLASALGSGDLSADPNRETPADRIGAMAFSDHLGSALWRLKWGNDEEQAQAALALLSRRVARRNGDSPALVRRICSIALAEWLDDLCRHCSGRGHMAVEGTPHTKAACPKCSGTGANKPSEMARIRALGMRDVSGYRKLVQRFDRAHARISEADTQAWLDIAFQLERVGYRSGIAKKVLAFRDSAAIMRVSAAPATTTSTCGGQDAA